MNVDVLHRLEKAVAERGPGAYVLTVSNDGRPHAVYLKVTWSDGRLVAGVGNTKTKLMTAVDVKSANSNFLRDYGVTTTDYSPLGTNKGLNVNSTLNWPANLALTRAQAEAGGRAEPPDPAVPPEPAALPEPAVTPEPAVPPVPPAR